MQLIVLRRVTGYNGSMMPGNSKKKIFSIKSDSKHLQPLLRKDILPLLIQAGFDEKNREAILVALGEGITNCIRHSYHCDPSHTIRITFEETDQRVAFSIRDYGDPADLERIKAKESPTLPPENPGGLGIYFMKTIMDAVEYNTSHSKGNELILTKKKQGA